MSSFVQKVRNMQRALGVEADGKIGTVTVDAMMRVLNSRDGIEPAPDDDLNPNEVYAPDLDPRSRALISTLDAVIQNNFVQFTRLAKATAAAMGCDYVAVSGTRTFAEQDALYAKGRTKPGKIVTKARGGYSNHNFGIAMDYGVFIGNTYLDGGTKAQQELAAKVHKAVSLNAAECGLKWGGTWKSIKDLPHFYFETGLTMSQMRAKFKKEGSVL